MPTSPSGPDLPGDLINKPGETYVERLKSIWFMEYARAIWERLIGGLASVVTYDMWVGNGGTPLRVIDENGNWVGPSIGIEDLPDPLTLGTFNATTALQIAGTDVVDVNRDASFSHVFVDAESSGGGMDIVGHKLIDTNPVWQIRREDGTDSEAAATTWAATTAYNQLDFVLPTAPNGYVYIALNNGTTAGGEPSWPTTHNGSVVDGSVNWLAAAIQEPKTSVNQYGAQEWRDWVSDAGAGMFDGFEDSYVRVVPAIDDPNSSGYGETGYTTNIEPGVVMLTDDISAQNDALYMYTNTGTIELGMYLSAGDYAGLFLSSGQATLSLYNSTFGYDISTKALANAAPVITSQNGISFGGAIVEAQAFSFTAGNNGQSGFYFNDLVLKDYIAIVSVSATSAEARAGSFTIGELAGADGVRGAFFDIGQHGVLFPMVAVDNNDSTTGFGHPEDSFMSSLYGGVEGVRTTAHRASVAVDTTVSNTFTPGANKTGYLKSRFVCTDGSQTNYLIREVASLIITSGTGAVTVVSSSNVVDQTSGATADNFVTEHVASTNDVLIQANDGVESVALSWVFQTEWTEINTSGTQSVG